MKSYPKVKTISLPKLIKKADLVFSQWIRNRDQKCVLCGKTENLQNGHLIKRSKKDTRWDEKNCNTLCKGCNKLDNFEHDHYVKWFIEKYSFEEYSDLIERSKIVKKPKREELNEIIEKYGRQMAQ